MMLRIFTIFLFIAVHAFAGYDVHITKRKIWWDDEGPAISLRQWKNLVFSDSEMRLDEFAEMENRDGRKLRFESAGQAVWTKYSTHGEDGNMAWFYWSNGEITVKNPDPEIRSKMFRIAQKLGAKVQGDEDELYDDSGNAVSQADFAAAKGKIVELDPYVISEKPLGWWA